MKQHKIPIWNGEFGPVYQSASDGLADWEAINEQRYNVLGCQLDIYAKNKTSWSIWLYKDIGFQGMTYVGEDTAYMKLLKPFLEKKKRLAADEWGCDDIPVREVFDPLVKWYTDNVPSLKKRYPQTWSPETHIGRVTRNILLSVSSDDA